MKVTLLRRIHNRILRSWIGQKVWYRYVRPPGAYCRKCGRHYTYREWSYLRTEKIFPQYAACETFCLCGAHEWGFVG